MQPFAQILAPLVLLLPALNAVEAPRDQRVPVESIQPLDAEQVSIQQRVTIRVSPRPAPMSLDRAFYDSGMDSGRSPRFIERNVGKCLGLDGIAGVQPLDNNRLLLIMRDRRMFTASLEKGCQGREFYSGFIVSRNSDAQICAKRDVLQSRSGMGCQVSGFKQLIPAGD